MRWAEEHVAPYWNSNQLGVIRGENGLGYVQSTVIGLLKGRLGQIMAAAWP